ncbi:MAG TPA: glycerophosphodiester phosphodiesterase [Candidatus Saccharimonadales bacterium]|nr:glycerophosphodiester phosphodiesterase [Candidatus Saccharimonadales bacterium]
MKVISHRGAAGLAPENTILGIKIARSYKVEYIEVDAQKTKDGRLVLLHDDTIRSKSGRQIRVKDSTLDEIRSNSALEYKIPTLEEALVAAGNIPLLIDCKGKNWQKPLADILGKFKGPKPIVACDDSHQLFAFSEEMPAVQCFLSELTSPFDAVQTARALDFSGICLLYSIYNPLVYFYAKRSKLKMTMYTVNRPIYAWFLHFFYPEVLITTDFPDKFAPRKKRRRKRKKAKRK